MDCTCDDSLQYTCTANLTGVPPDPLLCEPTDCAASTYAGCYVKETGCDYSITCNRNVHTIEGACEEARGEGP